MSLPELEDPFEQFGKWYAEVRDEPAITEPTAMCVATAGTDGLPAARMVLLKAWDRDGFVFYTNYESDKGRDLLANPQAALLFYWMPLGRQVRVQGRVEQVTAEEADAYFGSRARDSQIGAWASRQSRPMTGRYDLEKRVAEFAIRFNVGRVPRPDYWSGFRVVPQRMEFWQEGRFRLHQRLVYLKDGDGWTRQWLFP
ncbi:MAG: pyridoxamine 5'-phosphate oxidase [Tistrella sp.]|jgi:pyridoxamine 5'-phosphate oxidase|uniref:Pyridoxine/pyridoxamine 5'-phosphate oxidase n=1 Tax=Tistrella mobilis TaxID=171437 RepID=A0A3B9IMS7_9PROT|nr:pyridoxamine 5'-phosphate oxidase [Tistrella sp.]MAD38278.1 pyridoxamine 5'-phosphate oxidase [Tistrella sp.]MBA73855.1 pyridoxamine 5'-phosphate oxidase [Tistrella sp.]HAE48627.1 pyridoxamine 5'-phosphate oxidase [Tistrella mobilis]